MSSSPHPAASGDRTSALTRRWVEAIEGTSYITMNRGELRAYLAALVDRLISAIGAEVLDGAEIRAVAASMVAAHFTAPESLARSLRVLGDEFSQSPREQVRERVLPFLAIFAAGYADALRQLTLSEQQHVTVAAMTARQEAEDARWASERRFAAIFAEAAIGISVGTVDGEVIEVNRALCDMFGYTKEEFIGLEIARFVHPDDPSGIWELYGALAGGERDHFRMEKPYQRKDGSEMWTDLVVSLVRGPEGEPRFMVAMLEDITERHDLQARLLHQASHDPLTDLPNRTLFFENLTRALDTVSPEHQIGVCYLDLDGFKAINDTLGHATGDQLLQTIAGRLAALGAGRHIVARMGGDEFVILVDPCNGPQDVIPIAERALAAVRTPIMLGDHVVSVSASMGIATTSTPMDSAAELMKAADATLYWAKAEGRNRWALFDPQRYSDEITRYELARTLPAALARNDLFIEYQPLVRLSDTTLAGVEALVRWQHPHWGRLGPDQFIHVAEETGFITKLGMWVLRSACRQAAAWRAENGDIGLTISVNLAPHQVNDLAVVDAVADLIAEFDLVPSQLQLEITESAIMTTTGQPLKTLHALADLGVKITIDDFGTGYSNLAYLRTLPIDGLKLAGPFITSLEEPDPTAPRAIVGMLINLAHTLGLTVTAEGVETLDQLDTLRELNCDIVQGYYFAASESASAIGSRVAAAAGGASVSPSRPEAS